MNKAMFERQMKAVATGKPLKEVRILNSSSGEVFYITHVEFRDDIIYINVVDDNVELDGDDGQR